MAQSVAVVNATLTATASGTTDFTSSGFGTPSAAIVIVGNGNTTNNPQAGLGLSIGLWDGTNQCVHSISAFDALGTSSAFRVSRNDYIAAINSTTTAWGIGFQASAAPSDGIRLTMAVDNTGAQRYATVILLNGVSAKIVRLTLNSTVNGTATTGSLGFAPTAAIVLGSGMSGNSPNSGSAQTASALMSFGAATDDGTHRMLAWISENAAATATLTALYSETRAAAQVVGGAESWSAEVTAWGADDLTMTSRTAGSGGDDVDILCLGGADLSLLLGTLTTATSTGSADVTTTGIDPAAVLLCLGNTSSTTIASDATASGISVGISDGTTHGGYADVDEDAADTTNTESAYSSANAVYSRTSASGTASNLVVGAVSMGTGKFSVNYTTVSGTARKGWFLAFGPASGGGTDLTLADATHGHAADNLVLTSATALTVADATHAHAADNVVLTSQTAITVAEALHAHTADNVVLEIAGATNLTVAEALHAHAADSVVLTSQIAIVVAESNHAHTADGLTLTAASVLALQDALHAHAADNLTLELSDGITLTLTDALHAHTADGVLLTVSAYLVVSDASHAHAADNILLSLPGAFRAGNPLVWILDSRQRHTLVDSRLRVVHLH